jgi:hypothetical protein
MLFPSRVSESRCVSIIASAYCSRQPVRHRRIRASTVEHLAAHLIKGDGADRIAHICWLQPSARREAAHTCRFQTTCWETQCGEKRPAAGTPQREEPTMGNGARSSVTGTPPSLARYTNLLDALPHPFNGTGWYRVTAARCCPVAYAQRSRVLLSWQKRPDPLKLTLVSQVQEYSVAPRSGHV